MALRHSLLSYMFYGFGHCVNNTFSVALGGVGRQQPDFRSSFKVCG